MLTLARRQHEAMASNAARDNVVWIGGGGKTGPNIREIDFWAKGRDIQIRGGRTSVWCLKSASRRIDRRRQRQTFVGNTSDVDEFVLSGTCRPATRSPCHPVTLLPSYPSTQSPCHPVPLPPSHLAILYRAIRYSAARHPWYLRLESLVNNIKLSHVWQIS